MKKIFAGIVALITVLFIVSLIYASSFPTNIVTAVTEPGPTSPDWHLNVTGLVENPLNINWTTIFAMPKTTVEAAIICVDFPNNVVTQGNWTGVKLRTVLEEATPSQDAIKLAFYAADGYSTDLPLQTAMRDDIILAFEKDGAPLNDLRLVVPGKWGYKWISQLTRIELVNYNFLGYWEGYGYPDEATITASSPSPSSSSTPFTPSLPNITAPFPSPTSPTPSPSFTPSPSSSSPTTSPVPSQPTPDPSEGISMPTDVLYTIAGSVIVVVSVLALLFVRKRK